MELGVSTQFVAVFITYPINISSLKVKIRSHSVNCLLFEPIGHIESTFRRNLSLQPMPLIWLLRAYFAELCYFQSLEMSTARINSCVYKILVISLHHWVRFMRKDQNCCRGVFRFCAVAISSGMQHPRDSQKYFFRNSDCVTMYICMYIFFLLSLLCSDSYRLNLIF